MRDHLDEPGRIVTPVSPLRSLANVSGKPASAVALWSSILLIGLVILWRKSIGACPSSLTASVGCLSAGCAALLSLVAHGLYRSGLSHDAKQASDWPAGLVTVVSPLLFGLAVVPVELARDGSTLVAFLLFAALTAVLYAEFPSVRGAVSRSIGGIRLGEDSLTSQERQSGAAEVESSGTDAFLGIRAEGSSFEPQIIADDDDGEIRQWLTRRLSAAGLDCIEGGVKVRMEAREQQATVHIPFIPPFESLPEVSCHVVDDSGARSKVAAVYQFGTRIEVKRSSNVQAPQTIEMAFTAAALPASQDDAA